MLTVFIEHDGKIVFYKPFIDHKEAIDFYAEIFENGYTHDDAVIGITNETEINLGEPKKIEYIC